MPMIYGGGKSGRIYRALQQMPIADDGAAAEAVAKKRQNKNPFKKKPVMVIDMESGEPAIYGSISEAAEAMGCNRTTLGDHLDGRTKGLVKGRYAVTRADGSETE